VGKAVEVSHPIGDVLVERVVVPAQQCGNEVGRPRGGGNKRDFRPTGQDLSKLGKICGHHRHPQQSMQMEPQGVGGKVHVEGEDTSGSQLLDSPPGKRKVKSKTVIEATIPLTIGESGPDRRSQSSRAGPLLGVATRGPNSALAPGEPAPDPTAPKLTCPRSALLPAGVICRSRN
jgi:hypothetical protein